MAIVINEFEVAPEAAAPATPAQTPQPVAPEWIDLAQRLAQLEERELRVEAN